MEPHDTPLLIGTEPFANGMFMALQALGDLRYAAARGIEQDIVAALGNLGATRPTSLFEIRIFFWAQLKANHKPFSIAVGSGQNRLEERRIAFLIFLFEGLLIVVHHHATFPGMLPSPLSLQESELWRLV